MRRLTVAAPNIPATATQIRKKLATGRCRAGPATSAQISPAARKPLYSPWFAANFRRIAVFPGYGDSTLYARDH